MAPLTASSRAVAASPTAPEVSSVRWARPDSEERVSAAASLRSSRVSAKAASASRSAPSGSASAAERTARASSRLSPTATLPWAMAACTPPEAWPTAPSRTAAALRARAEASVAAVRLLPKAGAAKAEKSARVCCRPAEVSLSSARVPPAASIPSPARPRASRAASAFSWAPLAVSPIFARVLRASPTAPMAADSFSAARERVSSAEARESSTASSMAPTATSVTVDTKVEFTVSSKVVAPVSVILGETGPAFSFT